MIVRQAKNTVDGQTVWACDELNNGGRLGMLVDDDRFFEGDMLTAATDFCGLVTATGLSPGRHEFRLTLDGRPASPALPLTTLPPEGQNLNLLFIGDAANEYFGMSTICSFEQDAHAVYATEWAYLDRSQFNGRPWRAEPIDDIRGDPEIDPYAVSGRAYELAYQRFLTSYRRKHRALLAAQWLDTDTSPPTLRRVLNQKNIWRRRFCARFATRIGWDNHELYTIANPPWVPGPGQAQFDAAYRAATEYEFLGNPVNHDSGIDSEPSPVVYFRERLGDTEVVLLDLVSYSRSAVQKLMNGAEFGRGQDRQKAWLADVIRNSTARFLIIYSPTNAWPNPEWLDPDTGIFAELDRKPGTVMIVSANTHTPSARLLSANMPQRPVLEVGISPLFAVNPSPVPAFPGAEQRYFVDSRVTRIDPAGDDSEGMFYRDNIGNRNWVYGRVEIRPGGTQEFPDPHLRVQIKNSVTGQIRWQAVIREGERVPSQPS